MAKIAISLPEETLQGVEKQREDVEQYIRGYLKYPETQEEISIAEATLHYPFDEESWEEESRK